MANSPALLHGSLYACQLDKVIMFCHFIVCAHGACGNFFPDEFCIWPPQLSNIQIFKIWLRKQGMSVRFTCVIVVISF